ncbi:MAG: endolytic transglycosylase MltG [Bdellovibrionales bacterium]
MVSRKWGVGITIFVVFAIAFVGSIYLVSNQFLFQGAESKPREVIFELRSGRPFNQVAHELKALGVIKNSEAFILYARWTRSIPKVKAGEYKFVTTMTPIEVMRVLKSGVSIRHSFTVPEGFSSFEIAELMEQKGFGKKEEIIKLIFNPQFVARVLGWPASSLEGYLYPNSYQFTRYTKVEKILEFMVQEFKKNFKQLSPPFPYNWNEHQVVTLASIIEKETGAPQERPLISSVFHNRLNKKMRLQTDPTIIYAKALISGKIIIDIKKADLNWDHPYNTYRRAGLPPGPIANPGLESLKAAVDPAESDYLFFVSQNDGTHVFSENYRDHNQAVQDFQKNRKARQGKSWRDLNKQNN